jgi:hypothetical protein
VYCILINLDKSLNTVVFLFIYLFRISDLFQYCAPVFKDLHVQYTLVVAGVGFRTLTHHVSLWSWSLVHVLVVRTTLLNVLWYRSYMYDSYIHTVHGMCYTKTLKICCFCSCENAIVWHIQCSRCLKALDPSREYILPNTTALTKKH